MIAEKHGTGAGGEIRVRFGGEKENEAAFLAGQNEQHAAVKLQIDLVDAPPHLPVTGEHFLQPFAQFLSTCLGERHLAVDSMAAFGEKQARDAVETLKGGGSRNDRIETHPRGLGLSAEGFECLLDGPTGGLYGAAPASRLAACGQGGLAVTILEDACFEPAHAEGFRQACGVVTYIMHLAGKSRRVFRLATTQLLLAVHRFEADEIGRWSRTRGGNGNDSGWFHNHMLRSNAHAKTRLRS